MTCHSGRGVLSDGQAAEQLGGQVTPPSPAWSGCGWFRERVSDSE